MQARKVMVVVQKDDHSLGFYDFASARELRRVTLPAYPHEFVVNAQGTRAYICHFGLKLAEDEGPGGDEISVVDLPSATRIGSIRCTPWRRPHGIALDGAGALYVLSEAASRLLLIPDPDSGRIEGALPTAGRGSHIVSVTANGLWAFTSNMFSDTVSALDTTDPQRAPIVIESGDRPEGSAFDAGEKRLLVANRESANITVIDVARRRAIDSIDVPPGPVRIVRRAGATFLVALYHDQSLIALDADRRRVVSRVALPGRPVSIGFDRDSGHALAAMLPGGVAVVDVESATHLRTIATRPGPDPIVTLDLPL
ncbi:MAG: YncE family protein [Burkholderiaceae bacterium]|nr:YncE family protein [Burkholderiaceae bacterium]